MPIATTPVDPRTRSNLDALAHLFRGYAAHYDTHHEDRAIRAFFSARLLASECVAFLALDGDDAAGFVNLYPKYASTTLSRYWILNDLFVDPAHRRKGVAQALMRAAEDFARAAGAKILVLKTHVTNHPAQNLYEARGWKPGTDFLTYTKDLD
jgi:GNAT superfamily N-acetyltransferase